MPGLFLLIIRRALRNAPLMLAILVGLLVLVTLLVAAPLYTAALADVGLRATLADAPLDQRSVRAAMPARTLDAAEHARLDAALRERATSTDWLRPVVLGGIRTKRLQLPGAAFGRVMTLVEADTALDNLRVVEGRLPTPVVDGAATEVVLGATLALNQRQRAGYGVGADGRATLTNGEPLLAGALPSGVQSAWAFRTTIKAAGVGCSAGDLLAVDPEQLGAVAFNPPDRPVAPVAATLAGLGPSPPPDGIALPGRPRYITFTLDLRGAPFEPGAILSDQAGRYHRLRLAPASSAVTPPTFEAQIDLPLAAYPIRLVALALLPNSTVHWRLFENAKPPVIVIAGPIAVDDGIVEQWDGTHRWESSSDTTSNPDQERAGMVELGPSGAGTQPVEITLGRGMRAALLHVEPQEVEPIPVQVNQAFLEANRLVAGGTALLVLRNRPVLVQIGGIVERFPSLGIDGAPFVVAHGPRLLRLLNASFFRPATPNELWLRLPGDPAVIEQVRTTDGIGTLLLRTATLHSFSRDPLAVGIAGVFFLGFVTSVGLTALGFAVATYLAGRRRMVEFAVLQALGLSQRAVLLILAMEQAVLVTLALLAGTVLGIVLGRLIVPLMAIGDRGRAVVPPYQIVVPWGTLATTYLVLVVVFGVTTVLVLALLLRRGIGSALRTGEG